MDKIVKQKIMKGLRLLIKQLRETIDENQNFEKERRNEKMIISRLTDMEEYDEVNNISSKINHGEMILSFKKSKVISQCENFLLRNFGKDYWYFKFTEEIGLPEKLGIIEAIKEDIKLGIFNPLEISRAEVFADYLDMADHLLKEGYKDASAVIIGSTLENSIKKLAIKSSISLTFVDNKGQTRYKKSEFLNGELAASKVYSKTDQKHITAWLGIRNDAAHGNYSNYTQQQVENFLASVRDFISRHPA